VSTSELHAFFNNHASFFGQPEAKKLAEQGEPWRYYREKAAISSQFLEIAGGKGCHYNEPHAAWPRLRALFHCMQPLQTALEACAVSVVRDIAADLNLCPLQLLEVANPSTAVLRLCSFANHTQECVTAFAEHTDCSFISIGLCIAHEPHSDNEDGLEVRALDGGWHFAESGARGVEVVLFAGDMLHVLSNHRYLAAIHRVKLLPGAARLSAPFLVRGDMGSRIPRSICTLVQQTSCLYRLLHAVSLPDEHQGRGLEVKGDDGADEEKSMGITVADFRRALLEPDVMHAEIFEPIFRRSASHSASCTPAQSPALAPTPLIVPPYEPRALLRWAYSSSKKDEKWWTTSDEPRLCSGLVLAPSDELSSLTYGEITLDGVEAMLALVAEQPCCRYGVFGI
jgi:isopenicillin N synthase-like dioxygenase